MSDIKLTTIIVLVLAVILVSWVMLTTKSDVVKPFTEEHYLNLFGVVDVSESFDPSMVEGIIEVYTPSGNYYVIDRGSEGNITMRTSNRAEAIDIMLGKLIQDGVHIRSKEEYLAARKAFESSTNEVIKGCHKNFVGIGLSLSDILTTPSDKKLEGRIQFGSIALRGKKWIKENILDKENYAR